MWITSSALPGSVSSTESAPVRCLVTGSTGFIGRALVRRLRAGGAMVRGVARSRQNSPATELRVADLRSHPLDARLLDGIDTVYHLAAKTHDVREAGDAAQEYWQANVEATRHLLAALEHRRVRRVVFVSSVKAVSEGGPRQIDETFDPQPTTPYGRSKLSAERLMWNETERHGVAAVCVRFPLVYGPEQRGNLDRMIAAVDRGLFPPPPDNGNRRSMLHVENAADALILVGSHPGAAGQTYFVTDARPYATREVYSWIREALGKSRIDWSCPEWMFRALARIGDAARATVRRRVGFDREALEKLLGSAWYSCARIASELGYEPKRDLRAEIPRLVAAYRARRAAA